jgi:nicotinamide mononucleotide transporter
MVNRALDMAVVRADFAATSLFEWLAIVLGIAYVLLILRRQRLGWIAGGISSMILTVLAARSRLPMQALLQFSYVLLAGYGWWHWSREGGTPRPIGTWPLTRHIAMIAASVAASLALAPLLRGTGASDWPFTDSLIAFLGLFASWLTAQMKLENWLYWIAIDLVSLYLYTVQGHPAIAIMFFVYFVLSVTGFFSWWQQYRISARRP